ncbi:MAG: hypothetical protein A4E73_00854 [Syntrophaceae bacterium PtaU1.Bin231]|nr:MAG: hypothetical protein A4E73_00854 [Syntrophaceae bacterium PtaU1.Bin231]HOG17384.1 prepilin-type N-terminal cleavage/methylation domain-containing protein [Syntrophales bacterium]
MNHHASTDTADRGFTLVEVIVVLLVIGVIAAVAVSRVLTTQQDLVVQTDIVKTHLRFAQMKALNDDTATWGIAFAGGSYTLQRNGAAAAINLPTENSSTRSFPSGTTVTTPVTVSFDSWGSPGPSDVSITLSGDSGTSTIILAANTGFITP